MHSIYNLGNPIVSLFANSGNPKLMISKLEKIINLIPNHAVRVSTVSEQSRGPGRQRGTPALSGRRGRRDHTCPWPWAGERRGLRASEGQEEGGQRCKEAGGPCVWLNVPEHALLGKGKVRSAARSRGPLKEATLLPLPLKTLL